MPVPKMPVLERVDCTTISSKRLSIRTNNVCFLVALEFAFEFESDFESDFDLNFELKLKLNFELRSELFWPLVEIKHRVECPVTSGNLTG